MLLSAFSLLVGCLPPSPQADVVLVVQAGDPALQKHQKVVEARLRHLADGRLKLRASDRTRALLMEEGGRQDRENRIVEAKSLVQRAEERFRELDDEQALSLLVRAIARVTPAHQHPEAIELLAQAHLVAGAIFLARSRVDAARQRLQRALDFKPDISPPRHRFSPEVLAELAAVRDTQPIRPTGRLEVRTRPEVPAKVFIDGRFESMSPAILQNVGAGPHTVRVSADGFRSHIVSVSIEPGGGSTLVAPLFRDPERQEIDRLAGHLRTDTSPDDILKLIAERAHAEHVLLAEPELATELTSLGTATIAVNLMMPGVGRTRSPDLAEAHIKDAFHRLLACEQMLKISSGPAVAILGAPLLRNTVRPIPEPTPWWQRSWFWAVCAIATVGLAGVGVATRMGRGPPEAVRVVLVPRP